MKPLATALLEQESESSTIVFLMPDDVLRMPLAYWPYGLIEYPQKVYAGKAECSKISTMEIFLHKCSLIIAFIK